MSSRRDPDQLIKAFLDEGMNELPDRSFDAVRTAIDQTRQWAVVGPWKEPQIMTATRFALIAAAIAVMAVVAIRFLPSTNVGLAPPPTPTVAPTPSPSPTLAPSPMPLPTSGAVPAGSYYIGNPLLTNVKRLTFSVPSGWTVADLIAKNAGTQSEVMFTDWEVSHIFQDACKWDQTKIVDVGTTPEQLVTALAAQKSRTASSATSTVIDGFPAQQITLTVAPSLDTSTCTNGNLRYWPGPGPDFSSGMCCNLAGNVDTIYAVDVNGKREVIVARHYPGSSAADLAELQSIVDSIQIEP
jgi:hypothetical protein